MATQLQVDKYPRSAKYPLEWMMENQMGPNALWLAESLTQVMDLRPGMRVLDMGCGKAMSSIFIAREFGVQVWANDLWISATDNWHRIVASGCQERIFPIHAEARSLPYADGFFDAAVSLDSYHYYGTDDLYLGYYFAKLVKPGGQIGIVVPGLTAELESGLPEYLRPYWVDEFYSFHSPAWWERHWERSGMVSVETADLVPDGWRDWLLWHNACQNAGFNHDPKEAEMLRLDEGRVLGFSRVVAHRKG